MSNSRNRLLFGETGSSRSSSRDLIGIEPTTSSLPWKCHKKIGDYSIEMSWIKPEWNFGGRRIRAIDGPIF